MTTPPWCREKVVVYYFILYIELKLFLFVKLNLFLYVELNLFLYVELDIFLIASNSKCSTQLCSEFTQLHQRVLLFLHTYFMKSPVSGHFINAYSVKSSVILYPSLCSRTSVYAVSRVYTTLSTLDSALLCNSEIPLHILILRLCPA